MELVEGPVHVGLYPLEELAWHLVEVEQFYLVPCKLGQENDHERAEEVHHPLKILCIAVHQEHKHQSRQHELHFSREEKLSEPFLKIMNTTSFFAYFMNIYPSGFVLLTSKAIKLSNFFFSENWSTLEVSLW